MIRFSAPAAVRRERLVAERFCGVDYTSDASAAAPSQSPNGQNMIRDVPGKVRKCMGYRRIAQYPGRINGRHALMGKQGEVGLIHAGEALYPEQAGPGGSAGPLYTGMADERSKSWQLGGRLFILDGKALLVYDGETVRPAREAAYLPTVTIAKAPAGGGTDYEPLNLLQPGFCELFAAPRRTPDTA